MKQNATLLILLFVANILFAQTKLPEENITLGEPFPGAMGSKIKYINIKDIVVSVKTFDMGKMRFFTISTYDSKRLTLIESQSHNDKFPKNSVFEATVELNDKIYTFYSIWDKASKSEQLYAREINPTTCSFKGEDKLVVSVEGKITGTTLATGFYAYTTYEKYEFITSFDESKLLIKYRKEPKKMNDAINKDVIGYHVFNDKLSLIWGKEVMMPYTEKKMENLDYAVDSDGNVTLASLIYRDNTTRKIKNKEINYDIELISVKARTGELTQNKINLANNKHIVSLSLFEAANNELICTGYYSVGKNLYEIEGFVDGIFKFNSNQTKGNSSINYYDIPLDIINQNISQKQIDKNSEKELDKDRQVGLANLVPKSILISKDSLDGSMIIIGEVQYTNLTSFTSPNGRTSGLFNAK